MALLTAWATLGLASKVCGSVFGLLLTAVTSTYRPPIWLITFAYSFSAPTVAIASPDAPGDAMVVAAVDVQAVASIPAMMASTATVVPRRVAWSISVLDHDR